MTVSAPIYFGPSKLTKSDDLKPTILQRIAAGEKAAVDDCLREYSGLVWTLASRSCRCGADAEDAAQDIFLEIWQNANCFDPQKASEATFVSMLARRRLVDRYRKETSAPDMVSMETSTIELVGDGNDQVEIADEASKAASCFRKLPESQQSILGFSIHQGKAHSWISAALNMPLGTVKTHARRGLLQLRDCMKRNSTFQSEGGAS